MKNKFHFTFNNLENQFQKILKLGYNFTTCSNFYKNKKNLPNLTILNRVDIDLSLKKAERLCEIFNRSKIKATFFVRLHAQEYNPFSFENYRILKYIRDSGHEIGYHSEVIDESEIWNEDASNCLRKDIDVLNRMLEIKIEGIASHGGATGLNNLDFWKNKKASDFGCKYEAYDKSDSFNLFDTSFYISDSEWTQWKCYNRGTLCKNDRRFPAEHLRDKHPLVYLLIHPDTYFDRHFYE